MQTLPHLVKMGKEYGKKGLVVIIVTNSQIPKVQAILAKHGAKFPIARGYDTKKYGITGYPHAMVLDVKSKVVWEGHPGGGSWDGPAITALKQVRSGLDLRESKYPKAFRKVIGKLKEKKYKSALSYLKGLVKSKEDKIREVAENLSKKILQFAQSRLEGAQEMEKSKKYLPALEIYKMLAKEFRRAFSEGLQKVGSQAYKAQRQMEKDKKIKREIKAGKLFEKAKKYEARAMYYYFVKAYKTYRGIARKYKGTQCAEKAQERMTYLKNSGELNYNGRCPQCRQKRRACAKHRRGS